MALPANRLILPPSRGAVIVEAGALALWIGLAVYVVLSTGPPPAIIVVSSLPVLLFAWLVVALRRATILEVDANGIRRIFGKRLVTQLPFKDVGAVDTKNDPALRLAVLRVRDRKGKLRFTFVSGARASPPDVQFLHQAIAQRARELGIPVSPYIELPPELQLPLDAVRTAHGQRPAARVYVRPVLRLVAVLLIPLVVVVVLFPGGGLPAEGTYVILLWLGIAFVISPRTVRLRRRVVSLVRGVRRRKRA